MARDNMNMMMVDRMRKTYLTRVTLISTLDSLVETTVIAE